MKWDPEPYLVFSEPRLRPALELMERIPGARHALATDASEDTWPNTVWDLGCGTGRITLRLAERFAPAALSGLDSSPEMLARARERPGADKVDWRLADIAIWAPAGAADLIYSNAALHWLGAHEQLFPHLLAQLAPGGVLAVQMPQSWPLDSHRILREVLAGGGEAGAPLGDAALRARYDTPPVGPPARYYELLAPHARYLDIWSVEYLQVLQGPDAVYRWVSGSSLRPVLAALAGAERERFETVYRARLSETYPQRADGTTLYPFRRLFMIAGR